VDPESNILVFTASLNKVYDYTYFDAFDPKGNFINRVEVMGDFQFQINMSRVGRFFATISTNDDGLSYISLYSIVGSDI